MKDTLKKIGYSVSIVAFAALCILGAVLIVGMIILAERDMYLYSPYLVMTVNSVLSVSVLIVYRNYDAIVKKLDS